MSPSFRLILSTLLLCIAAARTHAAEPVTAEDVAVLRATLASRCESDGPNYFLLSTRVPGVDSSDKVPADWAEAEDLTARLRARAEQKASWSGIRVCRKVLVRRDGDIRRLIDDAPNLDVGWKKFYSVYRNASAVLYVSLPAYSADGNRAVVAMGQGCGTLCGSGEIVELEKKDGVWRLTRTQGTWIS